MQTRKNNVPSKETMEQIVSFSNSLKEGEKWIADAEKRIERSRKSKSVVPSGRSRTSSC